MLRILAVWSTLVAACSSKEPPQLIAPSPPVDGAADRVMSIPATPVAQGMRWLPLPAGVTDVRYATVQPVDVKIKLASSTFELPSSRPLQVIDDSLVAVEGPTPTPDVVAWANANRIVLDVSCRNPVPPELRRISCSGEGIDPLQLAAATKLQLLKVSIVSSFDDQALDRLPPLPELEHLELTFDGLTSRSIPTLARFPRLRSLSLTGNRITTLVGITALRALTSLEIGASMIESADLALLTELTLTALSVGQTDLDDRATPALAKLVHLELLDLSGTRISDAGLRRLAALTQLRYLDARDSKVTQAGCAELDRKLGRKVCNLEHPAAPDRGPATTTTTIGNLTVIDISPKDGALRDQLRTLRIAANGRTLLVETNASWCKPCVAFAASLRDPAIVGALADTTLVRVDFDRFEPAALDSVGLPSSSVPWFALLGDDGRVVDAISSSEWDDDTPANMAPVLSAFVHRTYTKRRHRWR